MSDVLTSFLLEAVLQANRQGPDVCTRVERNTNATGDLTSFDRIFGDYTAVVKQQQVSDTSSSPDSERIS